MEGAERGSAGVEDGWSCTLGVNAAGGSGISKISSGAALSSTAAATMAWWDNLRGLGHGNCSCHSWWHGLGAHRLRSWGLESGSVMRSETTGRRRIHRHWKCSPGRRCVGLPQIQLPQGGRPAPLYSGPPLAPRGCPRHPRPPNAASPSKLGPRAYLRMHDQSVGGSHRDVPHHMHPHRHGRHPPGSLGTKPCRSSGTE